MRAKHARMQTTTTAAKNLAISRPFPVQHFTAIWAREETLGKSPGEVVTEFLHRKAKRTMKTEQKIVEINGIGKYYAISIYT